jgi:exodeoxyribonuclease VII small subunit
MEKTFEASLNELERIVTQLEEGELSLEDSLKLFEQGVKLSRECQQRLAQAERRIEVLLKDAEGNPSLESLEPDSLRDDDKPKIRKRINFEEDETV